MHAWKPWKNCRREYHKIITYTDVSWKHVRKNTRACGRRVKDNTRMCALSNTRTRARSHTHTVTHTHTHIPPFFPLFIFLFPSPLRPFFPVDSAGDFIPTESGSAQLVRGRDARDVFLPGPSMRSFVTYQSFLLRLPSGLYPFCVSICWIAQSFVLL